MIQCPRCYQFLSPKQYAGVIEKCSNCKAPLPEDIREKLESARIENLNQAEDASLNISGAGSQSQSYGQGAIDTLRIFAWLNLITGTIIAIYIWSTMASIEVRSGFGTYHESNPLGIIIGIAFLVEGVFGCAFLLVVCSMAENLIAIRKNTMLKKKSDEES